MILNPEAAPGSEEAGPCAANSTTHDVILFHDEPVRIVNHENIPLLAATDLCRVLKLPVGGKRSPARYLRDIPSADRDYHAFKTRNGLQRLVVLTAAGAVALTRQRKRRVDQQVRSWLGRELLGTDGHATAPQAPRAAA